jgi:hypothetical protein
LEADWTVLVHLDANSSLGPSIRDNLRALVGEGGSDRVRLAVQIGDGPTVQRFVVGPQGATADAETRASARAPETLRQFVSWGMKALPARHTMLVMGGHGEGWRGVCTDGKGSGMPLSGLRSALQGKKVDVLGFDACQMGSVDVLAALGDAVPMVLASQELIGQAGWPYADILRDLKAAPDAPPTEVAKTVVERTRVDQAEREASEGALSGVFTLAACDMAQVPTFLEKADALAGAVLASQTPPAVLRGAVSMAQRFNRGLIHAPDSDFRDVVGFALALCNDEGIDDEAVRGAARDLLRATEKLVVADQHSRQEGDAHGLSAYLPSSGPTPAWASSEFAKKTRWGQMLDRIAAD